VLALIGVLATLAFAAGCGKSSHSHSSSEGQSAGVETIVTKTIAVGTAATATRNTTRLGGGDAVADAAAVARTAYPGLTATTRPQAVVVAPSDDWQASLAASALASAPLGAPLLYSQAGRLPVVSASALTELRPTGASALGGAQVLLLGSAIEAPAGYRVRGASSGNPYSLAVSVAQLLTIVRGAAPSQVIVVAAEAPPALAMPAAGLAALTGAPILFVTRAGVPAATATELRSLGRPSIYTVGSTAIGEPTMAQLATFGPLKRAELHAGEDVTAAGNAVAVSRFADGSFGWGIVEPGHGLVFANATQPFDAPAAAILSATGDYAPLLLLEQAHAVPPVLSAYLSDIQPAAPKSQPVRGVYNHGWLIGGEQAISARAQAELDAMLEIAPHSIPGPSGRASEEAPTATE
jgi:hypothetical protein